jgi:hypothetical protein
MVQSHREDTVDDMTWDMVSIWQMVFPLPHLKMNQPHTLPLSLSLFSHPNTRDEWQGLWRTHVTSTKLPWANSIFLVLPTTMNFLFKIFAFYGNNSVAITKGFLVFIWWAKYGQKEWKSCWLRWRRKSSLLCLQQCLNSRKCFSKEHTLLKY